MIWGAGGHGRVVGDLVLVLDHKLLGYLDQRTEALEEIVQPLGVPVIQSEEKFLDHIRTHRAYPEGVDACALGLGDNQARQSCLEKLKGLDVPPLVHPTAWVSPYAHLGRGSIVCAKVVVNTGARIGEGVILNSGCIIEHDCTVQSAVHVSPGAVLCGGTTVGERSWVGAGSTVIHGITMGADVIIGAGSTVIHDIADRMTVMGTPAKSKSNSLSPRGEYS